MPGKSQRWKCEINRENVFNSEEITSIPICLFSPINTLPLFFKYNCSFVLFNLILLPEYFNYSLAPQSESAVTVLYKIL